MVVFFKKLIKTGQKIYSEVKVVALNLDNIDQLENENQPQEWVRHWDWISKGKLVI